jgi:uncharacterized protein
MNESVDTALASAAREKEARLIAWLEAQPAVLLGFSGGVDSAYLGCVAAQTLGPDRVLAVIGRSPSYPAEQWATARAVATRFGLQVLEVDTHEMDDPNYVANPSNRCYYCKSELWSVLDRVARERSGTVESQEPAAVPGAEQGLSGPRMVIIDGTNADDLSDWRPGAQAARERGVRSPLAELGITKAEIRWLSRERGIPTWDQPSSPCLSSRLPYGTAVTAERLREVERAERALRALGVEGDLRVRHHGELARVELSRSELDRWLAPERLRALSAAVREAGFARVALDLKGFRSGSLNVLSGVTAS